MSGSGIYNRSGMNNITKADVQSFNDHQMPSELSSFHAFHVVAPPESTKLEADTSNGNADCHEEDALSNSNTDVSQQNLNTNDASSTDSDEEHPVKKKDKNRKVMFTKLMKSRSPSEWEDIGSQTDHSDMSEGHYSDETNEEKHNRELRNKAKSEKRVLRLAQINEKHNIVE